MPEVATAQSVWNALHAPSAIALTTSYETAPLAAITYGFTPRMSAFDV